ncbi:MAG TPA: mechanosensitive ion channel protein MscL [Erysipelothrix sp.]|nr:mechanosensitive ion channel protein MscL [Erysipelothrix sp.]
MIENFNDFLSLATMILVMLACISGFFKLNEAFKKDEAVDEYYRDLL